MLNSMDWPNGAPPYTLKVLDHGSVSLHNLSGPVWRYTDGFCADDTDPAKTARMSFDNFDASRTREMDFKLAEYLMKNKHTTPFEMIEVWLEMKLPIFLARQFVRHRTCTINEVSGRYVQLPAEWYIPEVVGKKPDKSKQGQTDGLYWQTQAQFKEDLNEQCRKSYQLYESYILTDVAPEHARLLLHLNHYTHWMWKQDLHNLMHFLSLRVDAHAQIEARVFANAIIDLIRPHLPNSMALFDKYRRLMPPDVPLSLQPQESTMESPVPTIEQTKTDIEQKIDQYAEVNFPLVTPPYHQVVADLCKPGVDIIKDLVPINAQAMHMAIGVSKEVAELLAAVIQKNTALIIEELGDIEFYVLGAFQTAGCNPIGHRDYKGAFDSYDIYGLVIAAGDLLDAGNRLGNYADDTKWDLYRHTLAKVRIELDKFYAVMTEVSHEKAIEANIYKLVTGPKARYKDGKYSNAAANNRADKDGQLNTISDETKPRSKPLVHSTTSG